MLTRGPQGLGPQEEPHARGSRLDVHTELFVYVGASRRECRKESIRKKSIRKKSIGKKESGKKVSGKKISLSFMYKG